MPQTTQVDAAQLALTTNGPAGSAIIQRALPGAVNGTLIIVQVSADFVGWLKLQQDTGRPGAISLSDVAWAILTTTAVMAAGNTILQVPETGYPAGSSSTFAVVVPNGGADTYVTGSISAGAVTTITMAAPTPFLDTTALAVKVATSAGDVYLTGNTSQGAVTAPTARYIR